MSLSIDTTDAPVRSCVRAAVGAEALGFDSVYCYDHISGAALGGQSSTHVWTALGAIAQATSNVDVGTLVANVTTRPAVDIAHAATSLQDATGGRFILGLGAGASGPSSWADEMRMFAFNVERSPERRNRVVEVIAFLRALWNGEPSFCGRWASFSGVKGVTAPDPPCPIIIGANGPKMAAIAGQHADGVNFHSWQPNLAELVTETRLIASQKERGGSGFTVSVETPLDAEAIHPAGDFRSRMAALQVDEIVFAWRHDRPLPPTIDRSTPN